jgi:hypothetical protein
MSTSNQSPEKRLTRSGTVPNRRYSIQTKVTNPSSQMARRYEIGSVYRQASRFNPFISSSTNISSSGSLEIIISDLEGRIETQSKTEAFQTEALLDFSDDQETAFINQMIISHRNMKKNLSEDFSLKTTIQTLQNLQFIESLDRQNHLYQLRMQVLKAFNNSK